MDKFRIEVLAATSNPQQLVWAAMHQDYSEDFVLDQKDNFPDEAKAGELVIKHLLAGNRGHYGPIEHPQITFNVGYFPHSMMQQVRTHRVGVSFDVQCLAGNTEITFVEASEQEKKIRINKLHDLWVTSQKYQQQLQKMSLRVLNEATGLFETSHLQEVICSGLQPVYRLTLEDDKTIDCTTNHRFLTTRGWQKMGKAIALKTAADNKVTSFSKDCFVFCNGIAVADDVREQASLGAAQRKSNRTKLKAHPVKVAKIVYLGLQTTYDLEVVDPWHNFVANGMVVHNSFRYTGSRIIDVVDGKRNLEDVFYLRPVGNYTNRQGKRYLYSEEQRQQDLQWCLDACKLYQTRINQGLSEEHARSLIPFDARQNFVMSCNTRSLMHLLDLRWKKDAQLEAQKFCELLYVHFEEWMPALAHWYQDNRAKKARLSP